MLVEQAIVGQGRVDRFAAAQHDAVGLVARQHFRHEAGRQQDEIGRQLDAIHRLAMTAEMPGKSISFGTAGLEAEHVALPSFTFSPNTSNGGGRRRTTTSVTCTGRFLPARM